MFATLTDPSSERSICRVRTSRRNRPISALSKVTRALQARSSVAVSTCGLFSTAHNGMVAKSTTPHIRASFNWSVTQPRRIASRSKGGSRRRLWLSTAWGGQTQGVHQGFLLIELFLKPNLDSNSV